MKIQWKFPAVLAALLVASAGGFVLADENRCCTSDNQGDCWCVVDPQNSHYCGAQLGQSYCKGGAGGCTSEQVACGGTKMVCAGSSVCAPDTCAPEVIGGVTITCNTSRDKCKKLSAACVQ